MLLPGGFVEDGVRRRSFAFRQPDGEMELSVAAARTGSSLPARVTAVLAQCLAELCGGPADEARVAALCVADRQFLVRQLAARLGRNPLWHQGKCEACGQTFDFQLDPSQLPVSEAGPGFPHAHLVWGGRRYRLRVPTGEDQCAIAAVGDEAEARRQLASRLVLACDDRGFEPGSVTLAEPMLETLESVLEEVAPQVVLFVQTHCPECDEANQVYMDPYRLLAGTADDLLDEIHGIAAFYHWSERQILALPTARRKAYLKRIDRARGMAS